ncbi:MAG: ATP-binding protein [Bacillota bacterium]|nr:ATP-binding protein [Bacillota bacterium]
MSISKECYSSLSLKLDRLMVYRDLLNDPIVASIKRLVCAISSEAEINEINKLYYEYSFNLLKQSETLGLKGKLHKAYTINLLITSKNFFSLTCEKYGKNIGSSLYNIAINDLEIIKAFMDLNFDDIRELLSAPNLLNDYSPTSSAVNLKEYDTYKEELLQVDTVQALADKVINYYFKFGSGEIANHIAFRWNDKNGLIGVKNYDPIQFDDIVGYQYQKETLINNTEAFIKGHQANNVLLVGARGTGKSSSIKALINRYHSEGLRLLEITKTQLLSLPEILDELKQRGKKFILFIDDLSFEEGEIEYKQMKSILDGGIEQTPDNVLIYATSNRRHLIKETWADRAKNATAEEIHESDTVNEKLSLSDRFGITLTFITPNQNEYLAMVERIAEKHNLNIPADTLRQEAIKWELSQKGRSGRTAKQFVNYLSNLQDLKD